MRILKFLVAALLSTSLTNGALADVIYGVKAPANDPDISSPPATLFSFTHTSPSSFSVIGNINIDGTNIDVDGLAVSRSYGLMGFASGGNLLAPSSLLVSINAGTAAASTIGSVMYGRALRGAMFDSADRLWAVDGEARSLLRIDPTSGAIISEVGLTMGASPLNILPATDIAQAMDGTVFLAAYDLNAATNGVPTLFTLDLNTGAATVALADTVPDNEVFNLPLYISGLAAAPGMLFGLDGDGQDDLFRYTLPGFTRDEVASSILSGTPNSGGLDLASYAPAPIPEPASLGLLAVSLGLLARARRERR